MTKNNLYTTVEFKNYISDKVVGKILDNYAYIYEYVYLKNDNNCSFINETFIKYDVQLSEFTYANLNEIINSTLESLEMIYENSKSQNTKDDINKLRIFAVNNLENVYINEL